MPPPTARDQPLLEQRQGNLQFEVRVVPNGDGDTNAFKEVEGQSTSTGTGPRSAGSGGST